MGPPVLASPYETPGLDAHASRRPALGLACHQGDARRSVASVQTPPSVARKVRARMHFPPREPWRLRALAASRSANSSHVRPTSTRTGSSRSLRSTT